MENTKILNPNGTMSDVKGNSMPIADYSDYPIPVLNLYGSVSGMTKDVAVTLNYSYKEMYGSCTLKWQGSSSVTLPKKNFTIKFDKEFEIVSGWGLQKKYVLKANFVDASHARNIVCAKLWGLMVKSRTPSNARLNALPNGGAIDGFPIILSINGEFQGIYTWNIPKDDWMFGMDDTGQQAIICAEYNNNGATAFKGLATFVEDSNGEVDFSLEYSSDDQSEWVMASLNRLLSAVKDSDGTNIEYGITPYLDWDSAIDYYIHACMTANYDGIYRNYLLATYDGVKWFFTGYDMDVVLGLRAMGKYFYPATDMAGSFKTVAGQHKLFELIWKYMRPQLRARYEELRSSVLSVENVSNMFTDFIAEIPLSVYVDDNRKWSSIPSSSANNLAHILMYYDLRCRNADKWIGDTSGQTTLPEQVNPNIPTITSISATYAGGEVVEGTALTDLTGIKVTASYSDGSTKNVTGYSLSGKINVGTNTITVTYEGLTTTFTVVGTAKKLTSISVTYTGGEVEEGTALTALTGITVTASYSNGTTEKVTDYTLSGAIVEGTNTITVTYKGKTATFTVVGYEEEVTLSRISATYSGGDVAVGTPVSGLTGITVKATYSDGTTATITGYTLSGTIIEGSNTITVSYGGKTTTFKVTGIVVPKFTNQMPISINTDGSIFNGVGYEKGRRISSSGVTKSAEYGSVTGYMPAKANDFIRFKDTSNLIYWNDIVEGSAMCQSVGYYNANFEFLGVFTLQPAYYGICNAQNSTVNGVIEHGEGMITLQVPNNANIAYMRLGIGVVYADGTGIENLIVTVNEEITD